MKETRMKAKELHPQYKEEIEVLRGSTDEQGVLINIAPSLPGKFIHHRHTYVHANYKM